MDPLSITASIIGILQLTKTLTGYLNSVRNATTEQQKVAIEASNLYGLLTSLRFRVEVARSADPWFQHVKLLGLENGPLDQLKDALETIVKKTSSSGKTGQIKSALTWDCKKSEVDEALDRIERLKSLITYALNSDLLTLSEAIHGEVVALEQQTAHLDNQTKRLQTLMEQESQSRLARWLQLPDPSTNYRAALEKRHPETGLWLLSSQYFNEWKASKCSLMWLHGNAGCGKTILSSALLQNILQYECSEPNTAVGYFYFDFNDTDKQNARKAIRSLMFQFALQTKDCLQALEQQYETCGNGQGQPAENTVLSLLRDSLSRTKHTYIILDALDECTDREPLFKILDDLIGASREDLHILATSRPEKDIEDQLSGIASHNINIESAIVDKDIYIYVRDRLATDTKLRKWPPAVQDEIITVLTEKSDGMFRWVYCQIQSIRQCIKLSALRKKLSSLPRTLDETYDRILQNLELVDQLDDAIPALQWLCFSIRPLHSLEMVDILAIQNGLQGGFFADERLPDPEDIMVVCSSLISCGTDGNVFSNDSDSNLSERAIERIPPSKKPGIHDKKRLGGQIRLAHFSVKEYLLSDRCALRSDFEAQHCHKVMAEGCLRYLLHLSKEGPLTEKVIDQYPLARYAAEYWWQHAQKIDKMSESAVSDLASQLLTHESSALLAWVQLYNMDRPYKSFDNSLEISDLAQPLYYAASIGLPDAVGRLLQHNINVNAWGGYYGNALQSASKHGGDGVVQMLLDAGADVNARGGEYDNALQAAASGGFEAVVQKLLDAGANVNAEGGFQRNALEAAAYAADGGSETVVRMLLDAGANSNMQSSALNRALNRPDILQLLLRAGIDVDTKGRYLNTPLQNAVYYGMDISVRMLLNAGADPNASGGEDSALAIAMRKGRRAISKMLQGAGARLEGDSQQFSDPEAFYRASRKAQGDMVQIPLLAGSKCQQSRRSSRLRSQVISAYHHETSP